MYDERYLRPRDGDNMGTCLIDSSSKCPNGKYMTLLWQKQVSGANNESMYMMCIWI